MPIDFGTHQEQLGRADASITDLADKFLLPMRNSVVSPTQR